MHNQVDFKPDKLFSFFISLFIVVDGFSAFVIGRIYLSYISDPAPYDIVKATDMYYAKVVAWLTFAYFLFCLISLVCWLSGKPAWRYVILVLGLLPFAASGYFLIMFGHLGDEYNILRYPFYGSLAINSLLFTFITFDIVKSKFVLQKDNT